MTVQKGLLDFVCRGDSEGPEIRQRAKVLRDITAMHKE